MCYLRQSGELQHMGKREFANCCCVKVRIAEGAPLVEEEEVELRN